MLERLPRLFVLVVVSASLCACTAHLYNAPNENKSPAVTSPIKGSLPVVKMDDSEQKILRLSQIVSESDRPGNIVSLSDLHSHARCGNYLIWSAMTLGLIPVHMGDDKFATVTQTLGRNKTETVYLLDLEMRYSSWEFLNFWHNNDATVARALAWAYVKNRTVKSDGSPD